MGLKKGIEILVIGGSGFIGRAIVRKAVSLGWKVDSLGLSNPIEKKREPSVNYFVSDINKQEELGFLSSKKYQYVVNTGGYIDHSFFSDGGDEVFNAHFQGTLNVLKVLDKSRLVRFVNIGSSDEYGNSKAPQSENLRERPISPYSAAKVAASHFLQMMHKTENFPSVSLRLFLCYGPGQDHNRFLPYLILNCLKDLEIKISPGDQLRDYCFIDDIVEAIFEVFKNDNANGMIFNIGSGRPISIKQVVEMMVDIIGSGKPNFGAVPYREGENMKLYADISSANKILGWKPKINLLNGLSKTIDYYKNYL